MIKEEEETNYVLKDFKIYTFKYVFEEKKDVHCAKNNPGLTLASVAPGPMPALRKCAVAVTGY